jgi:hypothetical protein
VPDPRLILLLDAPAPAPAILDEEVASPQRQADLVAGPREDHREAFVHPDLEPAVQRPIDLTEDGHANDGAPEPLQPPLQAPSERRGVQQQFVLEAGKRALLLVDDPSEMLDLFAKRVGDLLQLVLRIAHGVWTVMPTGSQTLP